MCVCVCVCVCVFQLTHVFSSTLAATRKYLRFGEQTTKQRSPVSGGQLVVASALGSDTSIQTLWGVWEVCGRCVGVWGVCGSVGCVRECGVWEVCGSVGGVGDIHVML